MYIFFTILYTNFSSLRALGITRETSNLTVMKLSLELPFPPLTETVVIQKCDQ